MAFGIGYPHCAMKSQITIKHRLECSTFIATGMVMIHKKPSEVVRLPAQIPIKYSAEQTRK